MNAPLAIISSLLAFAPTLSASLLGLNSTSTPFDAPRPQPRHADWSLVSAPSFAPFASRQPLLNRQAADPEASESDQEADGSSDGLLYLLPGNRRETNLSANETERFDEPLPGEYAYTYFISWAPRYFNVSDVWGHDGSYSPLFLTGMQWLGARFDMEVDYRSDVDERVTSRWGLGLSYTYQEFSSHEIFQLQSLDVRQDMSARLESSLLSIDLLGSLGYRWGRYELFSEFRSVLAWRFRRVKASQRYYSGPVQGFIDNLQSPVRDETRTIQMYQWGVGQAWHIGDDPTNFRLSTTFRPYNWIQWGERSTFTSGFGIEFRSGGLRLSDDLEFAFGSRFDFWLPNDGLNDIFVFELSFGLRFS